MSRLYSDATWRSDWWVVALSFVYSDLPDDGGLFVSQLMETGRDQGHVMSLGGGVVGMVMRVRAESSASAVTAAEAWMLEHFWVPWHMEDRFEHRIPTGRTARSGSFPD